MIFREKRVNMTEQQVIDIMREALFLVIKCSAPLLLVSLIVGLIISIFQTITSIQEQTLTFVPKIIAVFLTLMLLAGWIGNNLTDFMNDLWGSFNTLCGFSFVLSYLSFYLSFAYVLFCIFRIFCTLKIFRVPYTFSSVIPKMPFPTILTPSKARWVSATALLPSAADGGLAFKSAI